MKRKSIFFTLFVLIFGFCGTLSYFNYDSGVTSAVSQDASVWDGDYVSSESNLTESDWFNENGNDYYIRSAAGLSYFAYSVNHGTSFRDKRIYLETDIDLNNQEWTPIGNGENNFQGLFQGQGYAIYNLKISKDNSGNVGFFGSLTDYSRVDNLHLKNVDVSVTVSSSASDYYIGTMVGNFNNTGNTDRTYTNSYITNCSVEGDITVTSTVSGKNYYIGGLAGCIKNATVRTSSSEVDITTSSLRATNLRVGGLAGEVQFLTLADFHYDGSIDVTSTTTYGYLGGLIGLAIGKDASNLTTISNAYSFGDMVLNNTGSSFYVGGLIGRVENAYFTINNIYHFGDIESNISSSGTNYVGGLIGHLQSASSVYTKVFDGFYVGDISGRNVTINYLYSINSNLGTSQIPNVDGLYYDVDQKDASASDVSSQIVNLDDIAKTRDFYGNERYWTSETSWDFSSTTSGWGISSGINEGYPYLILTHNLGNANNDSDYSEESPLEGNGTATSPYLIKSAGDLGYVSFNFEAGAYYSLQNDIDLTGRTWQPIGTTDSAFSGVFDGNGYTIYGMTCSLQEQFSYHGLFGVTENAVIKNLNIRNVQYINQGSEGTGYVGTMVAYAKGDTYLINCTDNEYGQTGTMSDGSKVYAVGRVESAKSVYVFYGKSSINLMGNLIPNGEFYGNIDLSGTKSTSVNESAKIYYGYDIEIDGNGGTFYDSTKTAYAGKYHLLVLPQGEENRTNPNFTGEAESDVIDISEIDSTYGKALPQLSHLFGKTDTIIKRGHRAQNYVYKSNSENMFSDSLTEKFVESADTKNTTIKNNINSYNFKYYVKNEKGEFVKATTYDSNETYYEFDTSAGAVLTINYSSSPLLGLEVAWQVYGYDPSNPSVVDKDNAFQVIVIYNGYEKTNFYAEEGHTSTTYHQNSEVKLDENGLVYKTFYMEYDSFLSDYPEIFEIPEYIDSTGKTKLLRSGDFEIAGVYEYYNDTNSLFKNEILNSAPSESEDDDNLYASTTLVNSVLSNADYEDSQGIYYANLYTEWKGVEKDAEDMYKLTIDFSTVGTFAGKFEIADAIESVVLSYHGNTLNPSEVKGVVENNSVTFYFDTMYSDRIDNYLQIDVKLKVGYTSENFVLNSDEYNESIDLNFGELSAEPVNNVEGYTYSYNESVYTYGRRIQFRNLCQDYTLNLTIRRAQVSNDISIGEGVYFGLSPMVAGWTNVSMFDFQSNSFVNLQSMIDEQLKDENLDTVRDSYLSSTNTSTENQYVGYDFVDKRVMTSNEIYDSFEISANFFDKDGEFESEGNLLEFGRVLFRYDFQNGESRYFIYEGREETSDEEGQRVTRLVIYLYEINYSAGFNKDTLTAEVATDELVSLVYKNAYEYILNYYTNSTFAFVFTTDTNSTEFDDVTNVTNDGSLTERGSSELREIKHNENVEWSESEKHLTKISMTFEDMIYLVNSSNQEITLIKVATVYTKALFSFKVKYLDADGNLVDFTSKEGEPQIANKPTLSRTSGVYSVTSSGEEIELTITSTRYYRFFANRGSQNETNNEDKGNVVLYNQEDHRDGQISVVDTTSTFNIQINVSNANIYSAQGLDEDNAKRMNEAYEDSFNSYNGLYLNNSLTSSTDLISIEKGYWTTDANEQFIYQDDVYKIKFKYQTSDNDYGLQPGYYETIIVCTDVLYNMDYATKYVDADISVDELKAGNIELVDEVNSEISTSISVNGETYVAKNPTIKYQDSVTIETYMTNKLSYEFWGWFIKGSNYSKYIEKDASLPTSPIQGNLASWNFDYYSQFFVTRGMNNINKNGSGEADYSENNPYNITIYAVYMKKQTTITLSSQAIVYEENGTTTEGRYSAGSLGLNFSIQLDEKFKDENGSSMTSSILYQYLSADQSTGENITGLTNFKFVMSGDNANGYYLSGYRLYKQNGEVATDIAGENIESVGNKGVDVSIPSDYGIDLYAKIKELVEAGQTSLKYEFTIIPIIRQKTATVTFHSGTGEGNPGDGKKGEVFNVDGENSTNTYFTTTEIYFGRILYLDVELTGYLNGSDTAEEIVVDDLFNSRTGYSRLSNNYWTSSTGNTLNGSLLELSTTYFNAVDTFADIHFYRIWKANTYTITFMPNGGTFLGIDSITITTTYDSKVIVYNSSSMNSSQLGNITNITNVSRIGYQDVGWSLTDDNDTAGQLVFDEDLGLVLGQEYSLFDADGNYINAGNATVYAVWVESPYTIKVMLNGANSYTMQSQKTDIQADEQKEFGIEFNIRYGDTFENLFVGDGEENKIKIGEIVPVREGYSFAGIYAVSGSRRELITDATVFTTSILSCSQTMTEDIVLTLYASWVFDTSYLSLTLTSNILPELTYNAGQQTVYLADYFKLGHEETGYVVNLDENGRDMSIGLSPNMNSSILLTLTSSTATVDNARDMSFKVRNVGSYSVNLNITVSDASTYLNLGNVFEINYQFTISVREADISTTITDDVYLENIKRIMEPFSTEEFNAKLDSCSSLDALTTLMQSEDATIVGEAGEELNMQVYKYIMVKYYMLLDSNDGTNHRTYKEWTYADYLAFMAEENNASNAENIVSNLYYFDFYDYTITDNNMEIAGYDNLGIVSDAVQNVGLEIGIDKVVISSGSVSTMNPKNVYEMRVYLRNVVSSVDSLANYIVQYDSNGDAYITAGTAYLLPQVFEIQNLEETKSAYFDSSIENKEVEWAGNRESVEYDGKTYYLIENNLYISAGLYTSSNGDLLTDTVYSYTDNTNYLYFDDVSILLQSTVDGSISYTNVSSYFKLTLGEDDVFTILNTNGVANVTVTAKYLTNDDGMISFETVEDIMASELLRITRVYYNISGTEESVYDADGLDVGSYSSGGVLVYEITENNSNNVSIFLSPTVTKVVFTSVSLDITDYVSLYKWADSPVYNVDGTMDNQGSMTLDMSTIETSEDGLNEIYYYAIYTDLVLVKYNLNFPSSYNPSSSGTATMKLGVSTASDLAIPSENGFIISSLKAKTPTGETLDYTEIFTGADNGSGKTYVGITPETKHAIVTLEAKWEVEEIEYTQILEEYKTAVNSFTSLTVDEIVAIYNSNTNLYEYSYVWYFNDNQVATGQIMRLAGQGSYEESGNYKLVITATLNPEFSVSLDDTTKTSTQIELNFTLEFMRNLVDKVTFPDAETVVKTYDGREHLTDWSVNIDYYAYSYVRDDYEETVTTQQLYYVTTGSIYFKIFFNGGEIYSMKNAGEYRITVCFDEGMFDLSGIDTSNLTFIYTINPYSVDLSAYDFTGEKQFNAVEPSMTREVYLANENVSLQLRRAAGEDVGQYDLYFEDVLQSYKKNYNFTYGDVILFEDGELTAEASTTSIGKFNITTSGTLRLSYTVTALNPVAIEADYSGLGYSLKLTDDFRLQIFNGSVMFKEFSLNLFDVATGANISSDEILNILRSKISDLQPRFFNTQNYETAYDSMTYTYNFVMGDEISKYYTNIEFDSGYTFTINKITIDVSKFVFEKTYDGETTVYIDTNGSEIDLDTYSGVYITAVYATAHAGSNIRVDLTLQRKDSSDNLSNYSLTASYVVGKINKLDATMSFSMSKDVFTYGEVSLSNISSFINGYVIMNSENELVTDLLVSGYYTISYNLPATVTTNERGFIYKGNYTINVNADFQDFNMTLNRPSFEVQALQYTRQISENYIQISVLDEVQEYYEDVLTIQSTGDVLTLKLVAEGLTPGETASTGNYDLILAETSFLNGSIIVSVNDDNNGFQVLFATETVYVRIDDASILTNTYNGQTFVVAGDVSKTMSVTNGATNKTSTLSFFLKVEGPDGEIVEQALGDGEISFANLAINFENGSGEISEAGNYKLNILATCNEYTNVVFAEDYYLAVEKVEIDVFQFTFEKTYDGSASYIISEFNEKVVDDVISILVQFDSANAGSGKTASLYLSGADMNNYVLSAVSGTGTINKATATVELTKTDLVYGEVSLTQPLTYSVKVGGANLLPSQYNLTLDIQQAQYSSAGYLNVGTYNVVISSENSTNYDLALNPVQINVKAYDLTIELSVSGEISVEFNSTEAQSTQFSYLYMTSLYESVEITMTRASGTAIGYYKVLSGTSLDSNYNVVSVLDTSDLGAFRITQAKERLYLLLSDEQTVSASSGGDTATIEYDGNLYDSVSVEERSEGSGVYRLVFTNSTDSGKRQQFDLNFYTYDMATSTYNKTDVTVSGLTTNIQFLYPTTVKNVGTYQIYASGTISDSYEVKMGKDGAIYCFYLKIEKKELYFLNSELSKIFDNKDAIFEYADASEILSGIVDGEVIGLNMQFTQDGDVVKYAGVNYNVVAEIFGDTVSNYNLNLSDEDGTALNATIYRADMTFVVNSQSYTYGDDFELQYKYQTDVDLTDYDMGRLSIQLVAPDTASYYSTSGALKVGEYDMILIFSAQDFSISGYIVDNQEQEELTAKLTIVAKELQLVAKDMSLQEVFTKTYDATNDVKITDDEGNLLFDVSGINQGEDGTIDSVRVNSAYYANEYVGQAIQISFELAGEDSGNYIISPWMYGVIKAIIIGLEFDYHADGSDVTSNVDDNQLPTLSQLSFPFMSTSYLTANSASTSTNSVKNFPTSLTGKTGYAFLNWTMDFENIGNASVELTYLEGLVQRFGLQSSYDGSIYSVVVDNGENTVRFLNELLLDENDLMGYYYKNHSDLKFTFNANWDTNKYRITIMLADESGNSASYGQVEIDDGDPDTENTIVTTNYLGDFDYDSSLTLKATANEHCNFYGFYTSDGRRYTGTEPFISITRDGDAEVFTITNIRQVYNLVVRFTTQKVNVVFDLSEYNDAVVDSDDFVDIGGSRYQWSTDYLTLQDKFLSDLPEVLRAGFEVVSLSTTTTTIQKDNFATTKIVSLLPDSDDETVILTLTPNFEPVGVVVTLDYGYDNIEKEISVPYGQAYQDADDWEENPTRTGYTFDGWYNSAGQRVYGGDILATTEAHTLTAHWTINKYSLELNSPFATVSDTNVNFVPSGSNYVATDIEYNFKVTFKVIPKSGYEISAAWSEGFEVVINSDKTANVTFTMPADNVTYQLPVVAIKNTITIQGEHLGEVLAYDITEEGETPLDVTDNQVEIETGKKLKLVVSAEVGYVVLDNINLEGGEGVVVDKVVENGVMTATFEGINSDLVVTFTTQESKNQITISFDDSTVVESIEVDGRTYNSVDELPTFEASTNSIFSFYVKFKHGYALGSYECEEFVVNHELIEDGAYVDYYLFELSGISTDGSILINSALAKFTLEMEVISYDENKEQVDIPGNIALANGLTSVEAEYNSTVIITYQVADLYSFAGWSKDGQNIFSSEGRLTYTITQDETIYAIFSTLRFDIDFGTYNYYTIYDEYNDAQKTETVYTEISGGRYFDADTGNEISGIELYYGSNKTITYRVPTGYMYYGYGYRNGEDFVYLEIEEKIDSEVEINISSLLLNENNTELKIYIVVKAYSLNVEFETKIDIDGTREQDIDVGYISLQDSDGNDVNRYGYVDGTRVHYSENDFSNGQVLSNKHFEVVAYTGDVIYLKAKILKEGYKFSSIVANRQDILISKLSENDEYIFFEISNLVGGVDDIYIEVLFKPVINVINMSFTNNNLKVDGGAFTFNISDDNKNKIWTSGREYSSVVVSAYTDSYFEVTAFIRAGYYVNSYDLQIEDSANIIVSDSISYEALKVTDSGYTGKITFKVANYLGVSSIVIGVKPLTYTVALMEDTNLLATIDNVSFNSALNLTEYNASNITIVDERVYFLNGKLKVDLQKAQHNFEGYFTYQNGAGVQYINSEGNAVNTWQESGYVLNTLTSKYELSENASVDPETGKITIKLYLYWSYLKTRISFEFVPGINTNYTAQDMVSGVDFSNSWFYETAPLYIEVSFNTDIHITAPEIEGYKFYKFVISQKNASGTWLTDVTSFSSDIPWSTNEYDRIVECNIQVIYFAKVDVTTFGGEGTYNIYQESSDTQAKVLLQEGYVDTSKEFSIEAVPGEGYEFLRWTNSTTGQSTFDKTMTLKISQKTNLVMNLQGQTVKLNFEDYDTTFGQMTNATVQSLDNSYKSYRLGGYSGDDFLKTLTEIDVRVGDQVTFVLSVDFGFGIKWNRTDITFVEFTGNMYYFTMTISSESAGQTLDIIPTFEDEILAIYVSGSFVEEDISDNAIDYNNVGMAGYVTYNGQRISFVSCEEGQEIRIVTVTNDRYEIASITIKNYDNTFDNMNDFFTEEGVIVLSTDFMEHNNIVGTVQISIEYRRLLWNEEMISVDAFEGKGTSRSPYQISTVEDLILMMRYVNSGTFNSEGIKYKDCFFILTSDLQLNSKFWTPIGTSANSFNGHFNFNNHKITGVYTAYFYNPVSYNGLFGVLGANAEIVENSDSLWYVYLIIGLVALLILLLVILILVNRKRKKQREELSKR